MLKKLDDIKKRYEFLSQQLADSAVIADMGTWQRYSKEQSDLTETVEKYEEYLTCEREMTDSFALAETESDQEMKKMLLDEGYACKERLAGLKDELKIPKDYKDRIVEVEKYCTKPELEMLFIIAEQMESEFEKVKSTTSPKTFSKEHIVYNRRRYDNSTSYYRHYFGDRAELLVESIKRYKQLKGKHQRGELYLADLLK